MQGVYPSKRADGSISYRASLTHNSKHISLGSFGSEEKANAAYLVACSIMRDDDSASEFTLLSYDPLHNPLTFSKYIALVNLRDNGIYCRGPIYLRKGYFEYYLDRSTVLRFSADELFYYMNHSIQRRGGHLFVADYGSQINILNRYGVRSYAVRDRDYYFKNGDEHDFRSGNIVIVNRYNGVRAETVRGKTEYTTRIHVNGDIVVGRYDTEAEAAVAYNKAADTLAAQGCEIAFNLNYVEEYSDLQYKLIYEKVRIRL